MKSRKLISLALTLAMALTLTVPASAYLPEGMPVMASDTVIYDNPKPDPIGPANPGGISTDYDPYWDIGGPWLGEGGGDYDNPNGPAQVYVPDSVTRLLGVKNDNMTSVSLPKRTRYVGADLGQCTEIIYRGTAEDLINASDYRGIEFLHLSSKTIPVKDESGNILGWVGGDHSNVDDSDSKYPSIIGSWRMLNMVNQPEIDPNHDETIIVPDGARGIWNHEIKSPNMKRISIPKGFSVINPDNLIKQCTEIIYRGTVEDLIAEDVSFSYELNSKSTPIPVKDESGRIFGFVGGQFGYRIGGSIKMNILTGEPLPAETNGESYPVKDKSGQLIGYVWETSCPAGYFEVDMPADSTILATDPDNSHKQPIVTGFADVQSADWYAKAVKWAVDKGITSGTSATTFSPKDPCTHVQIIAFLHRAAGSPTVKTTLPFTPKNAWATEALKWAYAKYMIVGGRVEFEEDAPCTRAEAVNYIWEALDRPTANLLYTDDFTDVPSQYELAIAWAVQHKVTSGTSKTTFSPDLICDRGTIVTLLYNAYGGK